MELENWLKENGFTSFRALFLNRIHVPSVCSLDRDQVLDHLKPFHDEFLLEAGISPERMCYAEQVHGAEIAIVATSHRGEILPEVDGLITDQPELGLGIYVADCGAVYLVEPVKRVIALLHSGKKGTEFGITRNAIRMMCEDFGCDPKNIKGYLAPCIRPPAYEVDFAVQIQEQFINSGGLQENFTDCGVCTSSDRSKYYSYRMEKGKTGRMLAALAIKGSADDVRNS